MNREQRFEWMAVWCAKNNATLNIKGECGFGRECVGILVGDVYPDYEWYDNDSFDRLDKNGEVWTPDDAYHKCPCVAVLGRGEEAEDQLYSWLKWFDENGFKVESGFIESDKLLDPISIMFNQHKFSRMVKQ